METSLYILVGILLLVANLAAWVGTLLNMPGNWVIVGLAALAVYFLPETERGLGLNWEVVVWLAILAALGELLEFVSGAAGAAKQGASRRSVLLSLGGAVVGSLVGAAIGLPVPVIGPVVAAVGGGAAGAFAGAYLGETWKGRAASERMTISKAALVGRLLGTVGKLLMGAAMVAVATVAWFV